MSKKFRILAFVLSLIMAIAVFTSCSDGKKMRESGKYTFWSKLWTSSAHTLTSYSDMMMYQEMSRRTGIDIEFLHPASGTTGSEAFQILLASGNYPDMIEHWWNEYAGGPDAAIEDKVIISLNDYIKDYAPNYYDYMEGEKGKAAGNAYRAQSKTIGGNYYGFRSLNIGDYKGVTGFMVRKDLLDKWGLDIPTTIDDWENLFKVAKKNGVKYPFTSARDDLHQFSTAWKTPLDFYIDGTTIKYGPFENEYKNYLSTMRKWMDSDYIDIDFVTNTGTEIDGALTSGRSIATFGYVGSRMGGILPAMAERDPNFDLVACPWPTLNEGDIPWFQGTTPASGEPTTAITVECGKNDEQRYIDAIKWCDYFYSEEGAILKSFGIEGDTFTIEKGEDGKDHYVYTDKIYDHDKIGAKTVGNAIYHFMRPSSACGVNSLNDYLEGMYSYQQQKDALKIFNLYLDESEKHVMPPLQYTGDEVTVKANAEARAKDNLMAAIDNIVLGKQELNTFDKAINDAKKSGYNDILEVQQTAYDRYAELLKE